ncbi:MAG: glycosyltransferase [Oscillospiraceae bacterium]|jgi:glycosyltransferase involved in cell wall biosynthesis|nr:glycosyltransferase [Oscillospiraceae bacterium]
MSKKLTICLLNDSFPPTIDGVSNTVLNYADIIQRKYGNAIVATPQYPGARDAYDFPVIRYPSIDTTRILSGYRAGIPFSPKAIRAIVERKPDLIHLHCPYASAMLAKRLQSELKVPMVFTYHTKFDIDIANMFELEALRATAKRLTVSGIKRCDDVWAVSDIAGKNLESLGYKGEWRVMHNGVDFPRERASDDDVAELRRKYELADGLPVFLFVGRMMFYKGLDTIVDALGLAHARGLDFRMFFVGGGEDSDDVIARAKSAGIADKCVFTGAIVNRALLRVYFSMADAFLFPSLYDSAGLVVHEAAACSLMSVVIRDSAPAEGVEDGENGLLIDASTESLSLAVERVARDLPAARTMGERASRTLYKSWEDAVDDAWTRYEEVIARTAATSK